MPSYFIKITTSNRQTVESSITTAHFPYLQNTEKYGKILKKTPLRKEGIL